MDSETPARHRSRSGETGGFVRSVRDKKALLEVAVNFSAEALDKIFHGPNAFLLHDPDRLGPDDRDIRFSTQKIDISPLLDPKTHSKW